MIAKFFQKSSSITDNRNAKSAYGLPSGYLLTRKALKTTSLNVPDIKVRDKKKHKNNEILKSFSSIFHVPSYETPPTFATLTYGGNN